jgi:hypothetical protein
MSVTFNGAFTFSGGGFTATLAPPSTNTQAWFGGGVTYSGGPVYYSTVDRITYATDTATASVRGPLSTARIELAAASNISL